MSGNIKESITMILNKYKEYKISLGDKTESMNYDTYNHFKDTNSKPLNQIEEQYICLCQNIHQASLPALQCIFEALSECEFHDCHELLIYNLWGGIRDDVWYLQKDHGLVIAYHNVLLQILKTVRTVMLTFLQRVVQNLVVSHENCQEKERNKYSNATMILKRIVKAFPQCKKMLGSVLHQNFPEKKPLQDCCSYIKNCLRLGNFGQGMQSMILDMICDKLIQVDAQLELIDMPRDDDVYEDDVSDDDDIEDLSSRLSDYMFEMEEDLDETTKSILLAEKLDAMMKIVFEYLQQCSTCANNKIIMKNVYTSFIQIFHKSILRTYHLNSTQFLMFKICSFHPKFAKSFIDFLLEKIFDENLYPQARHIAGSYLASFLARANFVKRDVKLAALSQVSLWLQNYINRHQDIASLDIEIHSVFYSQCQVLFYVFCYIIDDISDLTFLERIPLEEIVESPFQPLIIIPRDVALHVTQALYYYDAYDFRAALLKKIRIRRKTESITFLEKPYFPFDPFVLRESYHYIDPIYSHWHGRKYDIKIDEDQIKLESGEEIFIKRDDDRDDDYMDISNSLKQNEWMKPEDSHDKLRFGTQNSKMD